MKITNTIRRLYDNQSELNAKLERRVRELFESQKRPSWFYHGRIKKLESFAQKIETGRTDPEHLEDFFACSLVVENRDSIADAVELVERFCTVQYRRPESANFTHKRPEWFPFDDLRLYVRLRPSEAAEPSPINEVTFEVQIKTFLQHAWGIATYGLIYKGGEVSWARARVAYQIKAMLEHAEVSISEVDAIAASSMLSAADAITNKENQLLDWFRNEWASELLPADRLRLARTILQLLEGVDVSIEEIIGAVSTDTSSGQGMHLRNLSPYGIVVRAIFNHYEGKMRTFLSRRKIRGNTRVLLTEEMEIGPIPRGARPERYQFVGRQ